MKLKTIDKLNNKLNNMLWEIRLGIRTLGHVEIKERDYERFTGVPYYTMWKILNSLSLVDSDVFVDIGCGKGRAVCCAARLGVRKVIGVEYSPELCRIAEANASKLRGRKTLVEIRQGRAELQDYRDWTLFYMFNPFGQETLDALLHVMKGKFNDGSSSKRIVYLNPVHERVFAGHGWLTRYEHWDKDRMGTEHSISFYKTV